MRPRSIEKNDRCWHTSKNIGLHIRNHYFMFMEQKYQYNYDMGDKFEKLTATMGVDVINHCTTNTKVVVNCWVLSPCIVSYIQSFEMLGS